MLRVRARRVRRPRPSHGTWRIDLRCAATPESVRETLIDLRARLSAIGLEERHLATVEIATAEALNNIVEHACCGLDTQEIRLNGMLRGDRLRLCLRDGGHPLPDGRLPDGPRPDPTGPQDTLPEGGFGWHLIRDLTERVRYHRVGGANHLWLQFHFGVGTGTEEKP